MTDLEGRNGKGRTDVVDEAAIARQAQQFADNFREARLRKGLSQTAISKAAKVHQGHISTIERGGSNPSLELMLRLAAAVREPLAELLLPRRTRLTTPPPDQHQPQGS